MKAGLIICIAIFLTACHNGKKPEQIVIPVDPSRVIVINDRDSVGRKQGRWDEDDTVHHRIWKTYNYKDDLLDGPYLEYKIDDDDTLIFGNYTAGKKNGTWTFWDSLENKICSIEIYENDTRKQTKSYCPKH